MQPALFAILEKMSQDAEVFELPIAIAPSDIDELGHVNNVVYLRWVQDVATAHWRAAATPEDQEKVLWVILRHEIDYKRAAMPGDGIVARTWVGTSTRATFERFTEIVRAADRTLLAKARTLWCPVDARTLRPMGVSASVKERFSSPAGSAV